MPKKKPQSLLVSILKKAKNRIKNFEHWCVGSEAVSRTNEDCSSDGPKACRWCATGAVRWASWRIQVKSGAIKDYYQSKHHLNIRFKALNILKENLPSKYSTTEDYNDKSGRRTLKTHRDILELFDRSIEHAQQMEN